MTIKIKFGQATQGHSPPAFAPGDSIGGVVTWSESKPIDGLEVSLLFESKGKGTPQREVADAKTYRESRLAGDVDFSFTAPDWPWSFSGKLISLVWFVQARFADPNNNEYNAEAEEARIIMSPSRSEFDLYTYPITDEPIVKGWLGQQQKTSRRNKRAWR